MGASKDTHIVEIPVDQEHHNKDVLCSMTNTNMIEAIEDHPLTEISESPGHLLLLKLWQREEDLFAKRIAHKETRMDSIKAELFQLSFSFFIFHGFFITLLFTSWANAAQQGHNHSVCKRWWVPSMVSLCTSLVFVFLVQVKVHRYWKVWGQLQKERNDGRAVSRCIQELRMKGASFDLSKEPHTGKRMKSSSVEVWPFLLLNLSCVACDHGFASPWSMHLDGCCSGTYASAGGMKHFWSDRLGNPFES